MKDSFPELIRAKDLITNTLLTEESKFKETIDHGLKILDDEINEVLIDLMNNDINMKIRQAARNVLQ